MIPARPVRWIPYLMLMLLAWTPLASLGRPVVALLSDFGLQNEAVGLCHGAILAIDSEIQIVDLTHGIKPFDIRAGALALARATTFPKGTVFVAVIDPGVGTSRGAVALKTRRGFCFVAPNNGLLTEVAQGQGVEAVVELEPKRINPDWQPGTFDGRDLFSPAGALLAQSGGDLARVGKPIREADLVLLAPLAAKVDPAAGTVTGAYTRTDEPYGNVWTNITPGDLKQAGLKPGDRLRVRVGDKNAVVPFANAFSDVPEGQPLAYINSEGRLALALNMGDLRRAWGLKEGIPVMVEKAGEAKK